MPKMPDEEDEEEGISLIGKSPFDEHWKAQKRNPKHKDPKSMVKETILEMEEHSFSFTKEEIIEHAKEHKVSKIEASDAIDDLIEEGWLHAQKGTNMLARTVWRDYSPAFEETFD